jgi:predicted esterase
MISSATVHTIAARTHGRFLVATPQAAGPWPMLVGFHGYAEDAARNMEALQRIPGAERWLLVAVQALHPFYTRDERIVANWMTRQDRELAIADNVQYVGAVLDALRQHYATRTPLVFAGFSQGGAMAYRAAVEYPSDALIVLAADVPPDVIEQKPRLPPVLLGRGTADAWYSQARLSTDVAALETLDVTVEPYTFEGGHEWAPEFCDAAGRVLSRLLGDS